MIHEYAKGLVNLGHQVTWFAYTFLGAWEKDCYDGIEVIRKFHLKISYFLFPWRYNKHLRGKYDIIIDEAGGLPLLSPLYEKKTPIVFFSHHVGDKERDYSYPWPLNKIGKWIYYQFIENACDIVPIEQIEMDNKQDRILFLGRLMPIKRVEDAIQAFWTFIRSDTKFSRYILDIVGNAQDKKYVEFLKKIATQYGVLENINFCGYIPREDFQSFISSHKVMLVPSMKEWFGLIVLEGNSYGIPIIWYNVSGLKDSIKDWVNGFLVPDGDYKAMWDKLKELIENESYLYSQSQKALNHVKSLEWWNEKVKKFEQILLSYISDATK